MQKENIQIKIDFPKLTKSGIEDYVNFRLNKLLNTTSDKGYIQNINDISIKDIMISNVNGDAIANVEYNVEYISVNENDEFSDIEIFQIKDNIIYAMIKNIFKVIISSCPNVKDYAIGDRVKIKIIKIIYKKIKDKTESYNFAKII